MRLRLTPVLLVALFGVDAVISARQQTVRQDIEALNAAMVSAFRADPSTVAAFYSDAAAIIGPGQRIQGRQGVDAYWRGFTMFTGWSLETLEVGGPADAPWQYGRSVLLGRNGQKMETYFVGLLRRDGSGRLAFHVDAFTGQRGDDGAEQAGAAFLTYLRAVEKADAEALRSLFDEQFVILSGNAARNKAEEIADLVPPSGGAVEYFRSEDTTTRGFGAFAVTTGVLKWKYNGREFERNHSTIAVKRGDTWKVLAQQVTPRR